jgi:hypothetical protein
LWDKKFGAKGSSVQMPVVEQRLIESERDIMKLDIIDLNRLNGSWANSFDALQTIASWFFCPYSKECHCRKVAKAAPDLSPKGGGGQ